MERSRITWVYALTLCLIAAVSANVLVKDECAKGPEFWCQDLMTAVKCEAIDHCRDTAWKGELDPLCLQCKQIVTILLNMVKASSIQDTIKKFLNNQCTHLPVSALIIQCHLLVEKYQQILIDAVESQINPQTICSSLTLCSSDHVDHLDPEMMVNHMLEKILPLFQENIHNAYSKAYQEQIGKGDLPFPMPMCWMCKSFIGRFEAAIPKGALAKSASALCLALPAKISGVCQCLVEKYTVILLDLILGKVGPKLVCGLLFMCATGENCGEELPVMPVLNSDITCNMCLAVTYMVKPTLSENATEADIMAALVKFCMDPELDRKECQLFVKEHETQLIKILQKQWDPMRTCKEVGVCPSVPRTAPEDSGCTSGPSYWCRNLNTAKECEAVSHCLTHVWR
ncbi:pulmonary surfactant-associated protein B [Pelodytes ibericus]